MPSPTIILVSSSDRCPSTSTTGSAISRRPPSPPVSGSRALGSHANRHPSTSVSRSIWRAGCTTTCASSTTACCYPGPSRRAPRSTTATSTWRSHRGPSVRLRRLRGRHPGGLRLRRGHAVGLGHLATGSGRHRCRTREGRPQVYARRLQTEGLVGAGPHPRPARHRAITARTQLAVDQTSRPLVRSARHHYIRAALGEE